MSFRRKKIIQVRSIADLHFFKWFMRVVNSFLETGFGSWILKGDFVVCLHVTLVGVSGLSRLPSMVKDVTRIGLLLLGVLLDF